MKVGASTDRPSWPAHRPRVAQRAIVDDAIRRTIEAFPFDGYMHRGPSMIYGAYANIATTVLRHLEPGAAILDFGCGPCDKTAVLQFLGYRCAGCDDLEDDWHGLPGNREKIASFADRCGIAFRQLDGGTLPFPARSFDMIMMHDVLEHLHDSPRELLNDLLELATPDGLLFLTVPNAANIRKRIAVMLGKTNLPSYQIFYWYPGAWRGHVREYVHDDLAQLAEYLSLDVLELRSCDHMLEQLPRRARPAYLLATSVFRGWKDSWLLVARKKPGWTPRRSLPRGEMVELLGEKTSYDYAS